MRATSYLTLAFVFALLGCDPAVTPATDSGVGPGVDAYVAAVDAAGTDGAAPPRDAAPRRDAGFEDAGAATAIEAPDETWTYVPIAGAECGNGSTLGVGVNLTARSTDVVLYFQGGGACWDALTCFTVGSASHATDTLTESVVLREARDDTSFLFERTAANPFRDASYVYMPYCTGDAHSGSTISSYGGREMHHVGAHNAQLLLERMALTFPDASHITLIGMSAGGYGVIANWWRAQEAFPAARVDALSDCGDPLQVPLGRWNTMLNAWGFEFPPACTDCDSLDDALPYYATTMTPPHRFGLIAYLRDPVISSFFTISTDNIAAGLLALRERSRLTPNQRTFFVDDNAHVLLQEPDRTAGAGGPTVREWVTQFATDDAAWTDVGP